MADAQPEVKIRIVKKKGGHAAAHGGAWKVAYADLVTALMSFFLLMWLLSSANANVKAAIAGYMREGKEFFNTDKGKAIMDSYGRGILPGGRGVSDGPDGGEGGVAEVSSEEILQQEQKTMENTAAAIEKAFTDDKLLQAFKDQINMDFTDEGLRIQVQDKAAQVLFDSGSAQLKPYTLAILKEIARELGKLPNHVVIGGHTDAVRYPTQAYTNWELSADRANAARRVMESSGFHAGQVTRVTGYAESIPLEGKEPKDPQNRRISIMVLNAASDRAENERRKSKGKRENTEKAPAKDGAKVSE
jgi:chemotaxis protein MotB